MNDTKKAIAILGSIAILAAAKTASVFFPISSQIAQDQINPDLTYEEQIGDASTTESSNNDLLNVTNNKTYTISYNNDGTKTWYFEDGFWVKFDSEYNVISHGLVSQKAASTITSPTGIFGLDIEKEFEGQIKEWPEEPEIIILGDGGVVIDFPEGVEIDFNYGTESVNGEPEFIYVGGVDPAKLPGDQSLSQEDAESTMSL